MKTSISFESGDLVRLKHGDYGLVIYKHPTKGVASIWWPDIGFNWESTSRLILISKAQ